MADKLYRFLLEILNLLYAIGYFSEIIVAGIVIYILTESYESYYFIVYLIALYINAVINQWLKTTIRDKRPPDPHKFLYSDVFSTKTVNYGMPSGHSQNVTFSITFLFLVIHKMVPWLLLCFVILLLTVIERWVFHNHTILQLLVGAATGILLAYTTFYICNLSWWEASHTSIDQLGKAWVGI